MVTYYNRIDKYWDDWEVGDKVITQGLTITESHIVNWASLSGDWFPLHMDEEFANNSPIGTRIAHGPMIFSLTTGLSLRSELGRSVAIAFLGLDRMRIITPVKPGDTIHCEVEVKEMKECRQKDRGIQSLLYHVKNQKGELVMEFELTVMLRRRSKSTRDKEKEKV